MISTIRRLVERGAVAGRLLRGSRGTTSVELALIIPILLLIIIGTVDFGRAIVLYNMTSEAAREGARTAQVQVTANPTPTASPALTATVATAVASAARYQTAGWGNEFTVTTTTGVDSRGQFVRVFVSTTYDPVARQLLGVPTIPLSATSRLYLP